MIDETKPPAKLPATFWVSRDVLEGELQDHVLVWSREPGLLRCEDGDMLWVSPELLADDEWVALTEADVDLPDPCLGTWSLAECAMHVGTTPDDARQCLRSGPAPAKS